MTPATTDKLPDLGPLGRDVRDLVHKRDALGEQPLKKCAAVGDGVRRARVAVEADLRRGGEARQFVDSLAQLKEYASEALQVYETARREFAGPVKGGGTLVLLVKEA